MEESSSANKRQRKDSDVRIDDKDSINRLPDELLRHILSFLSTEYAASTCILSRRWRYLWASVPNICFKDSVHDDRPKDIRSLVDSVFLLHRVWCLKKFVLQSERKGRLAFDALRANMWIRAAMARNVEEIHLLLKREMNNRKYDLPMSLFVYERLTALDLHGTCIKLPSLEYVSLPNLKTCQLKFLGNLTNKFIEVMLSGSPMLENLVTWTDYEEILLQIRSSSLKTLGILRKQNSSNSRSFLVIDTPILESLKLVDEGSDVYEVSKLPLLVKSVVHVSRPSRSTQTNAEYRTAVYRLIKELAGVKDLCLYHETINIFCDALADRHLDKSTFHNLSRLELKNSCFKLDPLELEIYVKTSKLLCLLKCFQNLEVIVLDKLYDDVEQDFVVPKCCFSSLKVIKFLKFTAKPFEMRMVKYCMKNAKLLKEVNIRFDDAEGLGSGNLIHTMQDIWNSPRESNECRVIFLS